MKRLRTTKIASTADSSSGAFGMYIQISDKCGIKILHDYGYSSVRKCEKSNSYKNAIREAKIQRAAFKSGRVAKVSQRG